MVTATSLPPHWWDSTRPHDSTWCEHPPHPPAQQQPSTVAQSWGCVPALQQHRSTWHHVSIFFVLQLNSGFSLCTGHQVHKTKQTHSNRKPEGTVNWQHDTLTVLPGQSAWHLDGVTRTISLTPCVTRTISVTPWLCYQDNQCDTLTVLPGQSQMLEQFTRKFMSVSLPTCS